MKKVTSRRCRGVCLRGAEDTKCYLAARVIVYRVLREMGLRLRGDLIFSATVDDEIGAWPGP